MNTEEKKSNAYLEAAANACINGESFAKGHSDGVDAVKAIEASATPILDDIVASVMQDTKYELVAYRTMRDFDEEKYGHSHAGYASREAMESDYATFVSYGYGVKMYVHGEFVKESAPK